jgi:hypothetical protein
MHSGPSLTVSQLPREITDFEGNGGAIDVPDHRFDIESMVDQVTRQLIQKAMDRTGGNTAQAARLLGIPRGTLRYKLKKYNLNGGLDSTLTPPAAASFLFCLPLQQSPFSFPAALRVQCGPTAREAGVGHKKLMRVERFMLRLKTLVGPIREHMPALLVVAQIRHHDLIQHLFVHGGIVHGARRPRCAGEDFAASSPPRKW